MDPTFLGVPVSLYGIPCLLLSFFFFFVWPHNKAPQHGWRHFVLRWGHSIVWLLLGLAAFIAGTGGGGAMAIAQVMAIGALLVYAGFVGTLVTTKSEVGQP